MGITGPTHDADSWPFDLDEGNWQIVITFTDGSHALAHTTTHEDQPATWHLDTPHQPDDITTIHLRRLA